MHASSSTAAALLFAVGLWTGTLDADGPGVGEREGAGGREVVAGAAEGEVPTAIPFAHKVGERWRLVVERWEGPEGHEGTGRTVESEAEVISPLGRDVLVEVRAVALTEGTRTAPLSLALRTAANAAPLDALGGGRLALRVDVRGSALALLNGPEVRAALARADGAPLSEAAWSERQAALLETWNSVYQACGLPLVAGRTVTTPLTTETGIAVGRDVRGLAVERASTGRALALRLSVATELDAPATGSGPWRESSSARYDLGERRLAGTRVVERSTEAGPRRVRWAFREAAAPADDPVATLARR